MQNFPATQGSHLMVARPAIADRFCSGLNGKASPLPLPIGRKNPTSSSLKRLWLGGDMPHVHTAAIANALNFGVGLYRYRYLQLCQRFSVKGLSQQMHMEKCHNISSRGSLIVLEGLDRSGKSSQASSLVSYLKTKGISVEGLRFPDRSTSVGQMISAYLANETQLDDRAIHLLFSANRWEKRSLMESKLRSGTSLVVDRYSYSGVAFSAAKGLDLDWCKAPEVGLIAPDLVIFLNVTPEKAAERGGYGTERYEQLDFQRKVAEHYDNLRDDAWKVVDGCLPLKAVEEQVREFALHCVAKCQEGKAITSLWLS